MKMRMFLNVLLLLLAVQFVKADNKTGINLYGSGLYGASKLFFLKQVNLAPDAEACYYLGESYSMLGQADSALIYYQKGLGISPDYPYNLVGLGKLKVKSAPEEALALFDQATALKGYKKNADLQVAIANAYLYAGDMDNAQKCIETARKYDASSAASFLSEGDIMLARKQFGDAASKYDMAIYFSSVCVPAYVKLAQLYGSTNRASALEKLNRAIELVPEYHGTYYALGELYQSFGSYGKAAEAYSTFIKDGYNVPEYLLHYASSLYFDGKYDKAVPVIESVLTVEPSNVVAQRLYAYCLTKEEKGDKSLQAMERFMNSASAKDHIQQDYVCYAEVLTWNKQYDRAIEQYKKALELDKAKKGLYGDMADVHVRNRNFEAALDCYNRYVEFVKTPKAEDILKLGKCYYNIASQDSVADTKAGMLHKADSLFAVLIEKVPDSYIGYFWQARTNSLIDPESTQGLAKPYYEKVIEVTAAQPDRYKGELVESYKYLGYYSYVKEDYPQAKLYFSKVLELMPGDEVAQRALKEIK